eukprot:COSAG02_NODE_8338_length_2609_cov_1.978486_1_plen_612_part_00
MVSVAAASWEVAEGIPQVDMGADGAAVPALRFTPRAEAMMDSIAPAVAATDRADVHRLAKTKRQEVVTKGGHEVVRFDGASAVRSGRRRDSLSAALEGNDDEFSTRQTLAQRVAMASASLGAKKERRATGVAGKVWRRLWMPIMMLGLGTAMLLLPLHKLLVEASPNAWSEMDDGEDDDTSIGELVQRFEVNEPVGAFLGVTALIYALIFAAAYSEAHTRLDEIRTSLTLEANGVHTAMLLVRTLDAGNDAHQTRSLLLFASYIEQLSEEIAAGCEALSGAAVAATSDVSSNIETLYAAVPYLSKICNDGENDEMDRVLVQRTIDMINKVSEARSIRETATHNSVSWITLLFLLEMGIITFFGVMMLQNGSELLNVVLPLLTFIALLSSVLFLADLALPFAGIVQVDTSIFDRIRQSISEVLVSVNQDQCRTLWVGSVPRSMIDCDVGLAADRLRGLFTRFGTVRSVTIRKKPSEYGSWSLVSFESEAAAERALSDTTGVYWKSTERLEVKKAALNAATGGGVAKQMIQQHNVVDDAPEQTEQRRSIAASKSYKVNADPLANNLPGMTNGLETEAGTAAPADRAGGDVTIHAEEHLEKAKRLARRRRASVV